MLWARQTYLDFLVPEICPLDWQGLASVITAPGCKELWSRMKVGETRLPNEAAGPAVATQAAGSKSRWRNPSEVWYPRANRDPSEWELQRLTKNYNKMKPLEEGDCSSHLSLQWLLILPTNRCQMSRVFLKDIWGRNLKALTRTTCKTAMFSVCEWQGKTRAGPGHGNWRWFASPLPASPSLRVLSQQLRAVTCCSPLCALGAASCWQKECQPPAEPNGEVLLVMATSCTGRASSGLLRSCNMEKVVCCNEQVTLKEQVAGIRIIET